MKTSILLIILVILISTLAFALPGTLGLPHDANDNCGAECQAIKGGKGMGISTPACNGLTGNYCDKHCQCSLFGDMSCKSSPGLKISGTSTQCTDDAVTMACVQGLQKQWECWCQDLFSGKWGPGANKGATCGSWY